MQIWQAMPTGVVLVGVLVASGTDLQKFRIPNSLTYPLIVSGLMYHMLADQIFGLSTSVLGILVGILPFIALCAKGGMGMGDLKLMAGVGAWMGPWFTLHVIIVSGLATGCYSVGLIMLNRVRFIQPTGAAIRLNGINLDTQEKATDVIALLKRPDRRANAVPFGVMVAFGVIFTNFWVE